VPAASAPASAASDVLGLTASGETWVAVRDAADKLLLNRTLTAGETLSLGGELPLSVTIGRKNAVTVTVRGKPFDHLKSSGPSEVARFTIK
jgi:cytoskeleton protein RodZ